MSGRRTRHSGTTPDFILKLRDLFNVDMFRFRLKKTNPNGDCFFESISIMLNSVNYNITTSQVRKVVADSILLQTDYSNHAIQNWLEIFNATDDLDIQREMAFMYVLETTSWPLPKEDLYRLSDALNDKNLYWGDQYAVNVVSTQTKLKICVICYTRGNLSGFSSHGDNNLCALLFLNTEVPHYDIFKFDGKYVFPFDTLPKNIQNLFN